MNMHVNNWFPPADIVYLPVLCLLRFAANTFCYYMNVGCYRHEDIQFIHNDDTL